MPVSWQRDWASPGERGPQHEPLGIHMGCGWAGYNKQLGLSNELFVLGDSLVLTVLGQVSFMPVLVLAARICPEVPTPPSSSISAHT